jgi:hypothetical protein
VRQNSHAGSQTDPLALTLALPYESKILKTTEDQGDTKNNLVNSPYAQRKL